MSLSRRKMIALIGGGTVLAATAGATGFAVTRTPTTALEPWDLAGGYSDLRKQALSYALLAPNPHNLQPWQAELVGEGRIHLSLDPNRRLPHTDPFDRQLHIGLGCFTELARMALAEVGQGAEITYGSDGQDGPIVEIKLTGKAQPDPLFAHILTRRSCKEAFADTPVPDDLADQLNAYATVHREREMVQSLKELTYQAWEIEALTPRTYRESVDLMRIGKAEINATPDGIDMGGAFFGSLHALGLLSRETLLDTNSIAYKQGFDIYRDMLFATPAYVSTVSQTNTRADQLEAGAKWVRLNLACTSLGLSLHPVSQALQEYPEMAGFYAQARELLAKPGQTVQMLGRLGYGPQTPRTPRWPLEQKLINGA
ncbi:MAG: twin-arginine translocation pathway signal protein [Pseudomonadota bacterium]